MKHKMIHFYGPRTSLFLLSILSMILIASAPNNPATVPTPVGDWTWPLDGNIIVLKNAKYGTTLENTDYAVKNFDLLHHSSDHITCFDVGWHRLYHAGVDFYRADGNTAGAAVKAVSDGEIVYVDQGTENLSVILKPDYDEVWAVYWHLENVQVESGDRVNVGQTIGYVYEQPYSGRFPDVHPFGNDDSHVHFEIRTFEDGGYLFPNYPQCNTGYLPGVGYTYPDPPDNYGYRDPVQWIEDRITPPIMTHHVYLPLIKDDSTCQEGQNLIQYNAGFEYPVDNPAPWFEIMTYFDPGQYYYHLVEDGNAHEGQHNALFGNKISWGRIIDEEMLQSVRIPEGVDHLEWRQYMKLDGRDTDDRFILALKDAGTGVTLGNEVEVDHSSASGQWFEYTIIVYNASAIASRFVSPSFSSINDGDFSASRMRVDEVSLITHCGSGGQYNPSGSEIIQQITVDLHTR